MERTDLPIAADYWPVLPGARLSHDEADRYQAHPNTCYDGRGDWVCTREQYHPLPHVALSGTRVCAVWDQRWFGEKSRYTEHAGRPVPVDSVLHVSNVRG